MLNGGYAFPKPQASSSGVAPKGIYPDTVMGVFPGDREASQMSTFASPIPPGI